MTSWLHNLLSYCPVSLLPFAAKFLFFFCSKISWKNCPIPLVSFSLELASIMTLFQTFHNNPFWGHRALRVEESSRVSPQTSDFPAALVMVIHPRLTTLPSPGLPGCLPSPCTQSPSVPRSALTPWLFLCLLLCLHLSIISESSPHLFLLGLCR